MPDIPSELISFFFFFVSATLKKILSSFLTSFFKHSTTMYQELSLGMSKMRTREVNNQPEVT